ncbi:acetoin reductase [Moniliophthora roreri MCA 2997]|uniref:Acetoin reductase n=1 Tax=Moniliophthora roreri (strain MCA 2997) TaxID=1381753 RepID=V2WZX7_MONRO|nr:acetoin reductase [Moniliophthora roreri MCA 2997]
MKVALVTGSAQGIGLAIATRLSQDPEYAVALNDVPGKEETLHTIAQGLKCKTLVVPGDVSKEEDVKRMVNRTVEEFGGLDVMVANAGLLQLGSIDTLSQEEFDNVLAVNVRGVFLCYKWAGKQMVSQGRGGRIIAASSMAGKRAAPYASAYSASKFAVRGLTQSAAQEYGKYGITVNAYAPGVIPTEMGKLIPQDMIDVLQASRSLTDVKGTPEDVANLVAYLVSDEAKWVTGQTLAIDGGINFD